MVTTPIITQMEVIGAMTIHTLAIGIIPMIHIPTTILMVVTGATRSITLIQATGTIPMTLIPTTTTLMVVTGVTLTITLILETGITHTPTIIQMVEIGVMVMVGTTHTVETGIIPTALTPTITLMEVTGLTVMTTNPSQLPTISPMMELMLTTMEMTTPTTTIPMETMVMDTTTDTEMVMESIMVTVSTMIQ